MTAHMNRPHRWPDDKTAILCEMIADGIPIREAGRRMGITTNAAIGKFDRLRAEMGWQAQ